jgi:predicted nucleic acid-binding Zn ribbon protein
LLLCSLPTFMFTKQSLTENTHAECDPRHACALGRGLAAVGPCDVCGTSVPLAELADHETACALERAKNEHPHSHCEVCGTSVPLAELADHETACALERAKNEHPHSPCEVCGASVPLAELADHETACALERAKNEHPHSQGAASAVPPQRSGVTYGPCKVCGAFVPLIEIAYHETACALERNKSEQPSSRAATSAGALGSAAPRNRARLVFSRDIADEGFTEARGARGFATADASASTSAWHWPRDSYKPSPATNWYVSPQPQGSAASTRAAVSANNPYWSTIECCGTCGM